MVKCRWTKYTALEGWDAVQCSEAEVPWGPTEETVGSSDTCSLLSGRYMKFSRAVHESVLYCCHKCDYICHVLMCINYILLIPSFMCLCHEQWVLQFLVWEVIWDDMTWQIRIFRCWLTDMHYRNTFVPTNLKIIFKFHTVKTKTPYQISDTYIKLKGNEIGFVNINFD